MISHFKKILKSILPVSLIDKVRFLKILFRYQKVKKTFEEAKPQNTCLSISDLVSLNSQFKYPNDYGYSEDAVNLRGEERANQLLKLIPKVGEGKFLELGCWDGMVCYHLQKKGYTATGIDNRDEGFDKRAIDAGIKLKKMDASFINFENESFDVVYSYDAFEHFSKPDEVLSEIFRVVKKGGFIYLEFGPLYMSPRGMHVYRQITVPYCQFLFSKETMDEFLAKENLGTIDYNHCNGWSVVQFRNLFDSYNGKLNKVKYTETMNYQYLDMIDTYAPIFKHHTDNFDNLLCDSITVLFQKL